MFTPFFMAYHSKSLGFLYSFIFFVFWNLLFHFVSLHVPSVIFLWHCWYFTHTVKFLHSRAQIINIDAFMLILWVEIFVKKKSSAFYDTATRRICRRLGCSHFKKKTMAMATMATTVEDNGNDYFAACLRFQCSDCDCVWSEATMAKHGGRRRYCFIGKCGGGATYWQQQWRSAYLLLVLASTMAG